MNLGRFLSNDSAFGRLMTKIGTIVAINVLFVITCIPFFTVGAAFSAMYHCIFEMRRAEDPINPFRAYWRGLRKNFVRATLCWLAFAGILLLGFMNLQICAQWSGMGPVLAAGVIAVLIVAVIVSVYLFPGLALYERKVSDLVKMCVCTAVAHPLNTLMIVSLNLISIVPSILDEVNRPTYAFAGTFFAFALVAYVIGKKMLPQFQSGLAGKRAPAASREPLASA